MSWPRCREAGLDSWLAQRDEYNPITQRYALTTDTSVNYMLAARKFSPEIHAMFKNVAAVLFDLDGTLVDSAPDLGAAADKMRTDRGLTSYSLDHYRPMAGAGARGMLHKAFDMTPEHPDFPPCVKSSSSIMRTG